MVKEVGAGNSISLHPRRIPSPGGNPMAGGFYSKAAGTCQESCGGRARANPWMNKNGIAKAQHPILTDLRQVVITQREPVSSASTRRLSQIRLIYYGCGGFGQILRSFSLIRPPYSPQTIEISVSNRHLLVTITNLGQPPRSCWNFQAGKRGVRGSQSGRNIVDDIG